MPSRKSSVVLKTNRLTLRPLVNGDQKELMRIFSDPDTMHFYERTKTIEEANQWISKAEALYQEKKMGFFACELKKTGEFVGICGLLEQKGVEGKDEVENTEIPYF